MRSPFNATEIPARPSAADPVLGVTDVMAFGDRPSRRILLKLGPRDRVQAVVIAYESGFVRPEDPS